MRRLISRCVRQLEKELWLAGILAVWPGRRNSQGAVQLGASGVGGKRISFGAVEPRNSTTKNTRGSLMDTIKRISVAAAVLAVFASASTAFGQEEAYVELMRSDLKTQKVAVITQAMQLTDEQSAVFWPVYREYEYELDKIADQRLALIRDYAEHFEAMTDEKAKELMESSLSIQDERLKLRNKYWMEFEQAVGSITAAKFMQVDNQISLLLDLQISANLPLVQAPQEPPPPQN
jgi:hypothetical protein